MIRLVNHQINKNLRFGYDVGQGYVTGEEEVASFLDSMIDNHKISKAVKAGMSQKKLEIIKELGGYDFQGKVVKEVQSILSSLRGCSWNRKIVVS